MALVDGAVRERPLLNAAEAGEIAARLAARHGRAVLDHARRRAAHAREVGDELAYDAWQTILAAVRELSRRAHR